MDPQAEKEYKEIRAILRDLAGRHEKAMARMDRLERKWQERMDRMERNWQGRMDRSEQEWRERADRMDRQRERDLEAMQARDENYDRKFQATRKLVEGGVKIVLRYIGETQALRMDVRELTREQRALNRWFRSGHNGRNGRGHGNGTKRR